MNGAINMDQSAVNNTLIGLMGIASIPFIISLIIFILWLYFGFGTLTRLTDIKYLLKDIIYILEKNNTSDELADDPYEMPANMPADIEPEVIVPAEIKEETPSLAVRVGTELDALRKPSKAFIWALGIATVVFVALMAIAFYINR